MKINIIEKVDGEYKVVTRDMTPEEEASHLELQKEEETEE